VLATVVNNVEVTNNLDTNLISPHLGDRVSAGWTATSAMSDASAPGDKSSASDKPANPQEKASANAIAALPLGGGIKIDPRNNQ